MKHQMKLYAEYFRAIKVGQKKVEIRLNDEKRRKIKIGDTIEFTQLPGGTETIQVQVIDLHKYETFEDLYKAISFEDFGSEDRPLKEMVEETYNIYTPEQEARWGVLAIRMEYGGRKNE